MADGAFCFMLDALAPPCLTANVRAIPMRTRAARVTLILAVVLAVCGIGYLRIRHAEAAAAAAWARRNLSSRPWRK